MASHGQRVPAPLPNLLCTPRNAPACQFHRQEPHLPPRTVRIFTHNESHSRRSKQKPPVGLVILRLSRSKAHYDNCPTDASAGFSAITVILQIGLWSTVPRRPGPVRQGRTPRPADRRERGRKLDWRNLRGLRASPGRSESNRRAEQSSRMASARVRHPRAGKGKSEIVTCIMIWSGLSRLA